MIASPYIGCHGRGAAVAATVCAYTFAVLLVLAAGEAEGDGGFSPAHDLGEGGSGRCLALAAAGGAVAEADIVEHHPAPHVAQRFGGGLLLYLDGEVEDLEDALEADHRGGELDAGVAEGADGAVELA